MTGADELGGWPVEWMELPRLRVDSIVEKGFENAARRACAQTAKLADKRRRAIARILDAPRFPTEWSVHLAKYWVRSAADVERCSLVPQFRYSLTVWRFAEFEVTATFDLWWIKGTPGDAYTGIGFIKNPPPGLPPEKWSSLK